MIISACKGLQGLYLSSRLYLPLYLSVTEKKILGIGQCKTSENQTLKKIYIDECRDLKI